MLTTQSAVWGLIMSAICAALLHHLKTIASTASFMMVPMGKEHLSWTVYVETLHGAFLKMGYPTLTSATIICLDEDFDIWTVDPCQHLGRGQCIPGMRLVQPLLACLHFVVVYVTSSH
jgi:hypothetical protein